MVTKSDFFLDPAIAFLNHGSYGATPRVLLDEQRLWQERLERQPVQFFSDVKHLLADARKALAEYIGCDMNDFVYVVNSTYGVNVAAHALAGLLQSGDELLTTDHEYGACDRAWAQHLNGTGVSIVRQSIPIPIPSRQEVTEIIWSGVTEKTRVLFLSHITSPTALQIDIMELCRRSRERGDIITVIDGAHAPGQIPLNLTEIDADIYTANCHKWMCTPKGSAFLFVCKGLQDSIKPFTVSWGMQGDTLRTSTFIDEHEYLGTRDLSAFLTVPAGIRWMRENDWESIQTACLQMRAETMDKLSSIKGIQRMLLDINDDGLQMGAVLLPEHWSCQALKKWLIEERQIEVMVQPWLSHRVLRFTVQAHTSMSDLERLYSAVSEYSKMMPG